MIEWMRWNCLLLSLYEISNLKIYFHIKLDSGFAVFADSLIVKSAIRSIGIWRTSRNTACGTWQQSPRQACVLDMHDLHLTYSLSFCLFQSYAKVLRKWSLPCALRHFIQCKFNRHGMLCNISYNNVLTDTGQFTTVLIVLY
jgi:hypothetical protein